MQDYKIDIAMSAIVNEKIVENIVKQSVEERTGHKIKTITPVYDGTKFTGFSITFVPDPYTYKSSNEFIETRYK